MGQLLNRVKNIILSPRSEWQAIKAEQATTRSLILNYAAVLLVIPTVAHMIGIGLVGFRFMGSTIRYSFGYVVAWGIVEYIVSIIGVIIAGMVINALAPTFESKKNSIQALKVAVYSFTPSWVAGVLGIIPVLNIFVLLGSLYGIYLLYLGLAPLMETPENKSVGYTVATIIALIVIVILINVLVSGIVGLFVYGGAPAPMMGE